MLAGSLECTVMMLRLLRPAPQTTPHAGLPTRLHSRLATRLLATTRSVRAGQNLVEKIVQRYALGSQAAAVRQGDFVSIRPHRVMTHDNTGAVLSKFKSIGAPAFFNPQQAVFTLDHDVQNKSDKNLAKYRAIESFAAEHGVDFYPAGRGIGHQIMVEEAYALPYTMVVASDSHSNMYGGIGCLGTPVVRTDAASIWATGQTWWQVPPVVKVELTGQMPAGVTGKDIIVALCGLFNSDQVLNTAIEFVGDGLRGLSVDDRLTVANMTTEWGALAGLFPVDDVALEWLGRRAQRLQAMRASGSASHPRLNADVVQSLAANPVRPDSDAYYAKHLTLDLSTLSPHVSGPNSVKKATPLSVLEPQHISIHKAYLLSCVNSRASDIAAAAAVLRGKTIAPGVEFYIAAASSQVQGDAETTGDWQTLLKAGAQPLPAGCGPCIGLGVGLLRDGEVGISATNRNYKGRMGSPNAQAYLASPAVVAASAAAGYICGPTPLPASPSQSPAISVRSIPRPDAAGAAAAEGDAVVVPGFTAALTGELVFCDADNLNTDGIYPGKYTYQDDMTPMQMAGVVMENYDPAFAGSVTKTDIVVGGYNFGTGSSREQAATALLYAGIRLVLAGSFSETFKRNAINNGLLVLEAPDLVNDLRSGLLDDKSLTKRTGWTADIDLVGGRVSVKTPQGGYKTYGVSRVGAAAQELVVAGGLEEWVKRRVHAA
ncbi:homoaconitase [Entophlyctis helioformis]|nr:homoaconitase [Entophlyctis helioformis]